jgi:glycosyltransferase involved in cell wall biosynthesis
VRILHTPTNTGGHPIGLSLAERELGYDSEVVTFDPNRFAFEVDRSIYREGAPPWRTVPDRLRFLAEAVGRYDVFHFNFGSTILPIWAHPIPLDELPLLRRLGKTIIATFQGDDARPPAYWSAPPPEAQWRGVELRRRHARERLTRYAHRVYYLNPDQRRWLPGASFCAYASFDPHSVTATPPRDEGPLTIVHAPSHRGTKGTAEILAAIDELHAGDDTIRLDLVENTSREETLARVAAADIAIDQVKVGWYGGFAVEAMSLGKPTLCYIEDEVPGDNPFGDELALVRTSAGTLARDLRRLLDDHEARRRAGVEGRAFVERWHDPRAIARRVLDGLVERPL